MARKGGGGADAGESVPPLTETEVEGPPFGGTTICDGSHSCEIFSRHYVRNLMFHKVGMYSTSKIPDKCEPDKIGENTRISM